MRRLFFLLLSVLLTGAAAAAPDVYYWFDRQTEPQLLTGNAVDCTALQPGIHTLHVQATAADGTLTPVRSRDFIVLDAAVIPSSAVTQLSYWFDGQTEAQLLTGNAVDCTALQPGIHTLHVQAATADGIVMPVRSRDFIVAPASLFSDKTYDSMVYFFDSSAERHLFTDSLIACEDLPVGLHTIGFQPQTADGRPCGTAVTRFFYRPDRSFDATNLLYCFDGDGPWRSEPLGTTELDISTLSNGPHTLYVALANPQSHLVSAADSAAFTIVCADGEHVLDSLGVCTVCGEPAGYVRAVQNGCYETLCLPHASSLPHVTGARFFTLAGHCADADGLPTWLLLAPADTLAAAEPYIYLATADTLVVPYFGPAVETPRAVDGLVGAFEEAAVPEGMYMLAGDIVVECGYGCSVQGRHAYIDLSATPVVDEADADAQGLTKVLFERMVGINLTEGRAEALHAFTPAGLRVPRSAKGIVILSTGKKILVK